MSFQIWILYGLPLKGSYKNLSKMRRKILLLIIGGLMGSLIGAAIYSTKIYLPSIWKNKEGGSIYAYLFLGFIAACGLIYFWLMDREDKR